MNEKNRTIGSASVLCGMAAVLCFFMAAAVTLWANHDGFYSMERNLTNAQEQIYNKKHVPPRIYELYTDGSWKELPPGVGTHDDIGRGAVLWEWQENAWDYDVERQYRPYIKAAVLFQISFSAGMWTIAGLTCLRVLKSSLGGHSNFTAGAHAVMCFGVCLAAVLMVNVVGAIIGDFFSGDIIIYIDSDSVMVSTLYHPVLWHIGVVLFDFFDFMRGVTPNYTALGRLPAAALVCVPMFLIWLGGVRCFDRIAGKTTHNEGE